MGATLLGAIDWGMTQDKDSHRDYFIDWKLQTDDVNDGPYLVSVCPGLPFIGSTWGFGNDADPFAYCWPTQQIKFLYSGEQGNLWSVKQTFSTRPFKRCQDSKIENPLAEPPKLSGSFVKYVEEATRDRHGKSLVSSSWELLRGKEVEFDGNRPTVKVGLNVLALPLTAYSQMVDGVNDAPLWGLNKRCVKLSNVVWERQVYGTCSFYYTVFYEFDINFNTFDRVIVDSGTKVFAGGDRNNPKDFKLYEDKFGGHSRVLLDGNGEALDDGDNPVTKTLEKYFEFNFLTLGIPTSL